MLGGGCILVWLSNCAGDGELDCVGLDGILDVLRPWHIMLPLGYFYLVYLWLIYGSIEC